MKAFCGKGAVGLGRRELINAGELEVEGQIQSL